MKQTDEEWVKAREPDAECVGKQCGVYSRYRIYLTNRWPYDPLTSVRHWWSTEAQAWSDARETLQKQ